MRTLVISMLIFLTASLSLIPVMGQPAEANQPEQMETENPEQTETMAISAAADPNAEITADTNSVDSTPKAEDFVGLAGELRQIDIASKDEMRGWTRRTDDKLDLVLAVQEQITTELNFLRQLAVEEGAVKTTAAIDRILSNRQERYKSIIERFEREQERLRREEEREREREERSRDRGRTRERPNRNR